MASKSQIIEAKIAEVKVVPVESTAKGTGVIKIQAKIAEAKFFIPK